MLIAQERTRPKIGLVLGGGGARGIAHIGILKLLDSLQIPVDCIVGTSIGSIGGALYAAGYTGAEIEQLVVSLDWNDLFTDTPSRDLLPYVEKRNSGRFQLRFRLKGFTPVTPSGLIAGQKVSLLFSRLTFPFEQVTNFDSLPIPYRAVAVDLVTGNEVILSGGSLALAMRASMSIPTVFAPVEYGDSLLIDGGTLNNYPVDVVKAMGADIVIGVNVGSSLKPKNELEGIFSVLEQTINIPGSAREREHIRMTDIYIHPYLSEFTAADFSAQAIPQLIERGTAAAYARLDELVRLKESLTMLEADPPPDRFRPEQKKVIGSLVINRTALFDEHLVKSQLGLSAGDPYDPAEVEHRIEAMRASGKFEYVDYEISPLSPVSVRIRISAKEKEPPLIHGVEIHGLRNLEFEFVYQLFGIRPGMQFNTAVIEEHINEMYALGYFNRITYEVEPAPGNMLKLIVRVEERPQHKLLFGVRYDDFHRLVGIIGVQTMNLLVPGSRIEAELQFAGLFRLEAKLSYPSRSMDMPAYPFIAWRVKDLPVTFFDVNGNKFAQYTDRTGFLSGGFGLALSKKWNMELEYGAEYVRIAPTIATQFDSTLFPSWDETLRQVRLSLDLDLLDEVLIPSNGTRISVRGERGDRFLGSAYTYSRLSVSADYYVTPAQAHTFRMFGTYMNLWENFPYYKVFYFGGPEEFVGLDYTQAFGSKFTLLRAEYRYRFKPDIYFKAIANTLIDYRLSSPDAQQKDKPLLGFGIAVEFSSAIGPLQLMVASGNPSTSLPNKFRPIYYVTAGYRF